MTERQLNMDFIKWLNTVPGCWGYKIPDIPMSSTKKPFDSFCCIHGFPVAIEFKKRGNDLELHQVQALDDFQKAGGFSWTGSFYLDKQTERNIHFMAFSRLEKIKTFIMPYNKGYDSEQLKQLIKESYFLP